MSDQNKTDRVFLANDGKALPVAELKVPMPVVAAPASPAPPAASVAPKAKPGS